MSELTEAINELERRLVKISELTTAGLQTDGAHHKQWFLGEILGLLESPEVINCLKQDGVDFGVAP